MLAKLALILSLCVFSLEAQCSQCVTFLVQSASLPSHSVLRLAGPPIKGLLDPLPPLDLPAPLAGEEPAAFLEKWAAIQTYDAGFLFEQALVRWAQQLNAQFGSGVGSLFFASVANRSAGDFESSTQFFSQLPSLNDFRLVLSTFRGPAGYDKPTIRKIQTAMASLLLAGLERLQRDLRNKMPLGELLLSEALPPSGEWDNVSAVYRLRDAQSKAYRGPFLRINVESFPVDPFVENPLAKMDSSKDGSTLGLIIELPSSLAESFTSDILAMRKWLKAYNEETLKEPKP